ncbi:MAG: prolipoprotein diacylglyceryl transferase family protein [Candidatus Magasanikbacteria bacterium]
MIPYFQIDAIQAGPITFQMWGIMVAAGMLAGIFLTSYLARRFFLSPILMLDIGVWGIIGGFIGGRFGHIVFYEFPYYWSRPEEILKFWHGGASSLGGFLGAVIAIAIFARVRGLRLRDLWPYLDIVSLGLWLGWGIGRVGCFFIHDHPGRLSDFWLAVNFPNGARHDLGLYESLVSLVIFAVFGLLFKKIVRRGWGQVGLYSLLAYSVIRFFLDFLRARDVPLSDPRYWFLTPAQWGMAVIFFGLTFYLVYSKITKQKNGEVA